MPAQAAKIINHSLEQRSEIEWSELIGQFCPIAPDGSIWRLSRVTSDDDPGQGWKLHISATVLEACAVFRSVVRLLIDKNVQFKVPKSLKELLLINTGLGEGYSQVGKFMTIYPRSDSEAVELAAALHNLTIEFTSITIPFDRKYCSGSNVFARYGAFASLECESEDGRKVPAILDQKGNLVPDDRFSVAPSWVEDPFPRFSAEFGKSFRDTPLGQRYRIFTAISQRGKGGVYLAADVSGSSLRTCVVKEGRRYGEIGWDFQDGYFRVETEKRVLTELSATIRGVPKVIDSFEVNNNIYLVLEHVRGVNLESMLLSRRRRLSFNLIVSIATEICGFLQELHRSGWVWGDLKPANLVRTPSGELRPLDFEGAYRIGEPDPYRWRTKGFSDGPIPVGGVGNDLFALGATLYFLITGRVYDAQNQVTIESRRRNVPKCLAQLTIDLLESRCITADETLRRLKELQS